MAATAASINLRIAEELGVATGQVRAAVELLDGGATVPFIARYRKEVTGGLDDTQLRTLEERLRYLRELEERRAAILESIESQGKLDDALRAQILAADTKARLEDIYLPFKPKRRTKAQIAREAGLEPLADALLADPNLDPQRRRPRPTSTPTRASPTPPPRWRAPARSWSSASPRTPTWSASCASGCGSAAGWPPRSARARRRPARSSPTTSTSPSRSPRCPRTASWRCSAARRRRCSTSPSTPSREDAEPGAAPVRSRLRGAHRPALRASRTAAGRRDRWLLDTVRWAWRTRILIRLGMDLRMRLWQAAEDEAVRVFAGEPARPAARRPRRHPRHHGPRPGLPHRREGRGRRRHRQGRGHRRDLPARAAAPLGRVARDAGQAGRAAQGRAGRHRQRHRLAGDRQAGRRADRQAPGAEADQGDGLRGRRLGLLGLGVRLAANCPSSTSRCAARSRSPAGCRTRWPSW